MTADVPILRVESLTKRYGGVTAVDEVCASVERGRITSLIGPNGAGKTTLFNLITGIDQPTDGRIVFDADGGGGVDLAERVFDPLQLTLVSAASLGLGLVAFAHPGARRLLYFRPRTPDAATAYGIARTFQNIRLFDDLSVLENVKVGLHSRIRSGVMDAVLRTRRLRRDEQDVEAAAVRYLEFVGLGGRIEGFASELAYGEQRRLEIARALATKPQLLLLDEPAAGMNPTETTSLMRLIERISAAGVTVLLIEHDMKVVMEISDRIIVLDHGRKIADGPPAEVRANAQVIQAYLGVSDGEASS